MTSLIARLDQLGPQRRLQAKLAADRLGSGRSSTRPTRCRPATSATRSSRPSATTWASCSRELDPPLPADDRHAPQRQGGGLPALPGPAGRGPLRGQVPGRRPHSPTPSDLMRRMVKEKLRQVRRHAALPGAPRLHRGLSPLRAGGTALRSGHRVRARRSSTAPMPWQRRWAARAPSASR